MKEKMKNKRPSAKKQQTLRDLKAYAFMTPALVILLIFTIFPILYSLVLMFYNYSVVGETKFVGLGNFRRLFNDRVFAIAIKNSLVFVLVVPVIQVLSILLAILVNKRMPGMTFFRVLY